MSDASSFAARACAGLLAGLLACGAAQAQLRLPGLPVPNLPGGSLGDPLRRAEALTQGPPLRELQALRQRSVDELLQRQADRVEADPQGAPALRGELLLIDPPPALLAQARALDYEPLRETTIATLELRVVVLRLPAGVGIAAAAARLRALAPGATIDFNHLYLRSGAVGAGAAPAAAASTTAAPAGMRVGLVDGGVDAAHPALRAARLQRWGCDGGAVASPHGTAVASLLVGQDGGFRGVQPQATLFAADVYCGRPVGGAIETIAQALGWLADQRVAVINLSLVGPPNRLLESVVRALLRRGHVLVAAVGNDGPAAPPLYPAAYEGVVGVTGVTAARRVLPEAGRGPHVSFAAPGADLAVAGPGAGYTTARGTSFAAPVVAGLLAQRLGEPDADAAARALRSLADTAQDLGAAGRDSSFGWGLVGEGLRNAPDRVAAAPAAQPLR